MIAFTFPGQGAEKAGFLHRLPDHPETDRVLDEASAALAMDVRALDTADALESTANAQPALVVAGVAIGRALLCEGVRPGVVAGLSIGAFSAAVVCGALAFFDAVRLARLRGELMQAAFPTGYGLVALEGLAERKVEALVREAPSAFIANVNAPRQVVIGGSDADLDAISSRARGSGAHRVERLNVTVPSHGQLMTPVAERLAASMAGRSMSPPFAPYVSNRGGRVLSDAAAIREDLAGNVAHTVRWGDALEVARELGAAVFVEMPPGHVSTRLVERAFDDVIAIAVDDCTLHDAVTRITRSCAAR